MFGSRSFVRSRRRSTEQLVIQFVLLATTCFVCLIGVVAFMHFSSPVGQAATTAAPLTPTELEDSVELIVPLESIMPGTALESSMFKRARRPQIVVGPEIVRRVEETKNLFSRGLLVANQPISKDSLTGLQPINALTASIPSGYRAVSIAVDAVGSVEGWAQPGARVDVIWVTSFNQKRTAAVIAPNAKVISANRQTEHSVDDGTKKEERGIPNTVTLLLANRDAMKVRLASLNGRLALVLRGTVDPGVVSSTTTTMNEDNIYNGQNIPAQLTRHLTEVTVTDRLTGKKEKLTFEGGNRVDD